MEFSALRSVVRADASDTSRAYNEKVFTFKVLRREDTQLGSFGGHRDEEFAPLCRVELCVFTRRDGFLTICVLSGHKQKIHTIFCP